MTSSRVADLSGWLVGAWLVVFGAFAVLLTQFVGTPNATVAALQSLTPFALLPLVAIAVVATVRQRWPLGFVAAAVGLGYLVATVPAVFPDSGSAPDPGARPIRVVAANLLYSNDRLDDAAGALAGVDADIVAMAEVTPDIAAELHAHPFAAAYPHRIERVGPLARGLVVWSKLPLASTDSGRLDRAIEAEIDVPDGPVGLVFVHPPPPVFHHTLWSDELIAIADAVAARDGPTIVLGDLNASVFHPPLRRLVDRAGLIDAVAAGGAGLSPTWPTDEVVPPFVRIDHVLVTRDLAVVDADVTAVPGSDHHAVVATVAPAASG